MGVACSRGNQSPKMEIKKPINKEVIVPNGVSNGSLPPKPNNNSNNKTTSESSSQSTEVTREVVRVKAITPEPITQAHLQQVSKALEVEYPEVAECLSLKHERGNDDISRDEIGIDAGGDEVTTDEGRGTEHKDIVTTPPQEQSELKVDENQTEHATTENIQLDAEVLSHSEQDTCVAAATDESGTRGDLNTSASEPDTGVSQDQADSQIIENNAKALVAEVISVATLEEQKDGNSEDS